MLRKIVSFLAFLCGAFLCGDGPVWAQSAFPFQISLTEGNNTSNIVNGATVSLASSGPGQTATASLTVTYLGTNSAVFNTAPQVLGAQNFTVVTTATFPLTLQPMGQLSFTINYVAFAPIGTAPITAQLDLGYVESGPPTSTSGLMALGLSGTTPNLSVSYTAPVTGNVTSLISGSSLLFPNTLINTTSTITITISNQGNGTGTVSAISVTGAGFQALGVPALPLNVPVGSGVQFLIEFAPTQAGSSTGALQMTLGSAMFTANLQGTATASNFSYQLMQGTSSQAVTPGQTITVPDTNVGSQNSVQVVVTNTGTTSGIISSILVTGTGFSITDGPALPLTLLPNGSASVTVTFAPTSPGPATGHLRFNNDTFNLTSNGIGPQLIYSYTVANSASVTIVPGGALVFSQTSVGQSSSATVTVQNTGTAPGTVISVGTALTAGSTQSPLVFTVANVSGLPASLAAGQSLTFTVVFSPNNTGLASGNLLIDTAVFALSGLGGSAVPLPAYSFSGPQGVQAPFQQQALGLSLASPYSLPLTGTLVLTQNAGTLSPDPAIQFSTGGQTVTFNIAANSTNAVFSNGSNQIGLQTGSVATTVTITPSFSTQAGLNLTPSSPQTLAFSVAAAAPQLLTAGISSLASNSFTLTITGYTTTRSLASLHFQIAANSSVNLSSSTTVLDVSGASQSWFQSSASQAFGGQFVVAIPFNIQVSSGTQSSPANALESISVTASNGSGVSNSLTATIP